MEQCDWCGETFGSKHGLSTHVGMKHDAPWKQESMLRELYIEKGMSTVEIADELGCDDCTVNKWLHKHGVEVRKSNRDKTPWHGYDEFGYETVNTYDPDHMVQVGIHRLIAVAEGLITPQEFINSDKHIHHLNGVPWDNRPDNLEALTNTEHQQLHYEEREINEKGQLV